MFKRVSGIVLGLASIFFAGGAAQAQMAVYAEASGGSLHFAGTPHMFGSTFGIYDVKQVGPVTMGADFRGAMMKRGSNNGFFNDTALDYGQFGFRIAAAPGAIKPLPKLMPYAEATVGLGYWRGGVDTLRQDATHALMQGILGADYAITPRVHWRVVEFTYGRAGAMPGFIQPATLSTGIVLQLPPHFFTPTP